MQVNTLLGGALRGVFFLLGQSPALPCGRKSAPMRDDDDTRRATSWRRLRNAVQSTLVVHWPGRTSVNYSALRRVYSQSLGVLHSLTHCRRAPVSQLKSSLATVCTAEVL